MEDINTCVQEQIKTILSNYCLTKINNFAEIEKDFMTKLNIKD